MVFFVMVFFGTRVLSMLYNQFSLFVNAFLYLNEKKIFKLT
jgi:hypothetical protein